MNKSDKNKEDHFKFDLPNWHLITPKTISFIFDECEKRLQASLSTNSNNRQAAYKIISIVIPVIALSTGYGFTHREWFLFWPLFCFICVEFIGLVLLLRSIQSLSIMPMGEMPESLIDKNDYYEYHKDNMENWQYVGYVINYCAVIQKKIMHNEAMNSAIARKVDKAIMICGAAGPAIFIIASLLAIYR